MTSLLIGGCRAASLIVGSFAGDTIVKIHPNFTCKGSATDRPERIQRVALFSLQLLSGLAVLYALPSFSSLYIGTWTVKAVLLKVALPALLQGTCCSLFEASQDYLVKKSSGNWTKRVAERSALEFALYSIQFLAILPALTSASLSVVYPVAILFGRTVLHLHDLDAFSVPTSIKNAIWQRYSSWKASYSVFVQDRMEELRNSWNDADPKVFQANVATVSILQTLEEDSNFLSSIPTYAWEGITDPRGLAKNDLENSYFFFTWMSDEGKEELITRLVNHRAQSLAS